MNSQFKFQFWVVFGMDVVLSFGPYVPVTFEKAAVLLRPFPHFNSQEELKIVRLTTSMLKDEQLEERVRELLSQLDLKKDEKQQSTLAVANARKEIEAFRDDYETLVADDKTLDKMFRKEFSDLDTHTVDILYRLFKRRPRSVFSVNP